MPPKTIDYLAIDTNYSQPAVEFFPDFTISFTISSKVTKQKRTVYGFLTMFGDVGGLNDFI